MWWRNDELSENKLDILMWQLLEMWRRNSLRQSAATSRANPGAMMNINKLKP